MTRQALMREVMSLRTYLTVKAMEWGTHPFVAIEAVSSTAIEHPEWDLDEKRSWVEWEEWNGATGT